MIAVGGVDVKSAARPGHRTRREGAYPRLPSTVHVSSAVCGKPSSSVEPWRGNWLASVVDRNVEVHASEELSALGPSQSCDGRKSYDRALTFHLHFFNFFPSKMSHGDVR